MADVYAASAFTKNNSGGNEAGVVLNGQDLTTIQKRRIAEKLGYSETAFVLESSAADYRIEYFTPTEEVPLCGHATIAAFSVLRSLRLLEGQAYTIETKAGILKIQIRQDGLIFMEQNRPEYLEILDRHTFDHCIETKYIDEHYPIQIVSTGLKDILLPVRSEKDLEKLAPCFERMTKVSKEKNVIGVHAFSLTKDAEIAAICRNFAPLYGIDEESATGTSSCALACYLFKYDQEKSQYIFEQGHHLGKISRIVVQIVSHESIIDAVYVGGYGRLLYRKTWQ